jgi:hypothetical protein
VHYGVSKADGVLWLWQAHNRVNMRLNLTGGLSNDPVHPKLIFPTELACAGCRNVEQREWIPGAVYGFLRDSYCSREPEDSGFACAQERGRMADMAEIRARSGGVRGLLLALFFCALCVCLASLRWVCRERFEVFAQYLEEVEDRKLSRRLDKEAALDARHAHAEAERVKAEEERAAGDEASIAARLPSRLSVIHSGDGDNSSTPTATPSAARRTSYRELKDDEESLYT